MCPQHETVSYSHLSYTQYAREHLIRIQVTKLYLCRAWMWIYSIRLTENLQSTCVLIQAPRGHRFCFSGHRIWSKMELEVLIWTHQVQIFYERGKHLSLKHGTWFTVLCGSDAHSLNTLSTFLLLVPCQSSLIGHCGHLALLCKDTRTARTNAFELAGFEMNWNHNLPTKSVTFI